MVIDWFLCRQMPQPPAGVQPLMAYIGSRTNDVQALKPLQAMLASWALVPDRQGERQNHITANTRLFCPHHNRCLWSHSCWIAPAADQKTSLMCLCSCNWHHGSWRLCRVQPGHPSGAQHMPTRGQSTTDF